jgi:HlyD family secretion protein
MNRRLPVVVLAVGLLAGGAVSYVEWPSRHDDGSALVLLGNIDVRQVELAFKVDGRIATMAADEGDVVKPGQVLATLDRSYFDNDLQVARSRRDAQAAVLSRLENGSRPEEVSQAQANVALAQANAEVSHVTLDRQGRLLKTGVAAQQTYDNALAASRQAEAQLTYARQAFQLAKVGPRAEDIDNARAQLAMEDAQLAIASRRLADADLVAPADGVILSRVREPGAIVAAGTTAYVLSLTSPVWVRAYVAEPDLGRIRPGMTAHVTTDSAPGKAYTGHIGYISPVAEFTPKSVETRELRTDLVYRLRVIVDNPDGGLRQGMPVTVTLDLAS